MSNNYQNNYFPDDSDPAGQAEYFAQVTTKIIVFFDQNFDHSTAKYIRMSQYILLLNCSIDWGNVIIIRFSNYRWDKNVNTDSDFVMTYFSQKIINGHTKLCHHPIFAQTKIVGTLNCRPLFHLLINFAPNGLDSNWGRYPESHFHWFLEEISHYKIRICIYIFMSSIIRKSYNYNISPINNLIVLCEHNQIATRRTKQ